MTTNRKKSKTVQCMHYLLATRQKRKCNHFNFTHNAECARRLSRLPHFLLCLHSGSVDTIGYIPPFFLFSGYEKLRQLRSVTAHVVSIQQRCAHSFLLQAKTNKHKARRELLVSKNDLKARASPPPPHPTIDTPSHPEKCRVKSYPFYCVGPHHPIESDNGRNCQLLNPFSCHLLTTREASTCRGRNFRRVDEAHPTKVERSPSGRRSQALNGHVPSSLSQSAERP